MNYFIKNEIMTYLGKNIGPNIMKRALMYYNIWPYMRYME